MYASVIITTMNQAREVKKKMFKLARSFNDSFFRLRFFVFLFHSEKKNRNELNRLILLLDCVSETAASRR